MLYPNGTMDANIMNLLPASPQDQHTFLSIRRNAQNKAAQSALRGTLLDGLVEVRDEVEEAAPEMEAAAAEIPEAEAAE